MPASADANAWQQRPASSTRDADALRQMVRGAAAVQRAAASPGNPRTRADMPAARLMLPRASRVDFRHMPCRYTPRDDVDARKRAAARQRAFIRRAFDATVRAAQDAFRAPRASVADARDSAAALCARCYTQ